MGTRIHAGLAAAAFDCSGRMDKFFKELRRRAVFRVAGVYAVVGWLLAQVAGVLESSLGFPGWFDGVVVGLLLIGFPVAMVLAWAFEMTPEGVKRTSNVGGDEGMDAGSGHRLDYAVLIGLVSVAALVVADGIIGSSEDKVIVQHGDPTTESPASAEAVSPATSPAAPAPVDRSRSIAVLPFADFSPGGDQEWFSDGLTEEILNSLARTPDLLVASRTSSFRYRDADEEVPVIAQRLGVEHVLEGSVRRAGDRLRVTAQLIRASDGFHLWSETYDRSADDIIAIQEDIAVSIAKALETAMDPEALAAMVSSGTRSVEAYEAYLEGRAYQSHALQEFNLDLLAKARDAFARAVSIDGDFAEAHYLAGGLWATLYQVTTFSSDESVDAEAALARGLEHFDTAIETTDDPVRALKYKAERASARGALRENIRALEAYVAAVPNDLSARFNLIQALNEVGDRTAALTHAREAEARLGGEDDELAALIQAYQWARDYESAARLSRRALDSETNNASLLYQAQRSLLWAGDVETAAHARARLSVRGNAPDWTGVADLVRKVYGNPDPCGLDQWTHAVGLAFGAAEQGVRYYTRSANCNRLDGGEWTMASMAALYAGDPAKSLAIVEQGRDVYEATLREEAARLRALMANGRMAEARAGLSRLSGSDNLRASMEGELAAATGDRAGALAARDRLLTEAAKDPDVFDAGLRLSAQAGDRETANALAAEIDARPAGPMLLLGTVYFCRCGAPFDLEATPTLAERLMEAELAWPPASPVDWPLKDW